jgi:hypothetical protein
MNQESQFDSPQVKSEHLGGVTACHTEYRTCGACGASTEAHEITEFVAPINMHAAPADLASAMQAAGLAPPHPDDGGSTHEAQIRICPACIAPLLVRVFAYASSHPDEITIRPPEWEWHCKPPVPFQGKPR